MFGLSLARSLTTASALTVVIAASCFGCGGDGSHVDEIAEDTETQLETYWTEALGDFSNGTFAPPDVVEVYTEDATPSGSACLEEGDPDWADNSFYCPPDEGIYLDADFVTELGAEFQEPDTATVMVHAHEFGHHLQNLDGAEPNLKIGKELEADCYAGVFLSAVDDGDVSLVAHINAYEALQTMRDLADSDWEKTGWFAPGAHGGPIERTQAMATGFVTKDAEFCQGYETTDPIVPLTVGSYIFRPPPASNFQRLEHGYRMRIESESEIYMDITDWGSLRASATNALAHLAPRYLANTHAAYVGHVEPFNAPVADFKVAILRYAQMLEGQPYHGALVLVTRGDGTALVMDSYTPGAAPPENDYSSWELLGDYAFAALWGMTAWAQ